MSRFLTLVLFAAVAVAGPAGAQTPRAPAAPAVPLVPDVAALDPQTRPRTPAPLPTPPPAPEPARPAARRPSPAPPAPPAAPAPPRSQAQPVNVRVEFTITDIVGDRSERKVVSFVTSDGNWGRVRSRGQVGSDTGPTLVMLNVDGRPRLQRDGQIGLELTVEYLPDQPAEEPKKPLVRPSQLSQTIDVYLKDGEPMLVSQAVDPVSNRRTTIEVKATRLP